MEQEINKLFEYFDEIFLEERIEVDEWGTYGAHYQGLSLDTYLSDSVLGINYLSIEDYLETEASYKLLEGCAQYRYSADCYLKKLILFIRL